MTNDGRYFPRRWRLAFLLALVLTGSLVQAQPAASPPFAWQNPIDFSYPYNDGARDRSITELRDPAIMPFGDQYIQEVDLRGIDKGDIKLLGQRKMIVACDNADVGKQTSPDYMEGPWMIKRNGKYILFTASPYRAPKPGQPPAAPADLAQGYWVGAAVADNIWGPYKKQPQVFLGGHIAVFTGPDGKEWFAYRGEAGGKSQGRLCIDPIPFNDDGSPRPFAPPVQLNSPSGKDDSRAVR